MDQEKSESGAPIFRHEASDRDFEPAVAGDDMEKISDHIEFFVGPIANVFHEIVSDMIHVDVHVVNPTPERNFYTLITSGMSDKPMNTPDGCEEFRHSEVMLCLPPDWEMAQNSWENEEHYWPVRMLKFIARFPHEYQTWLWLMHTIPNGDPPVPFAPNTEMSGMILLPPLTLPPEFHMLEISPEKQIYFNCVVPLHPDEMELKLKKGAEALFDGFEKNQVTELLIPNRSSTVPKKKGWFGFGKR